MERKARKSGFAPRRFYTNEAVSKHTKREDDLISKITEQLFLSQVIDVLGPAPQDALANLEGHGITHILSVCPESDLIEKETALFANNGFSFHSIPVPTNQAQPNEDPWKKGLYQAIDKVTEIFANNLTAKVLVHCIEGRDRSPFVVANIIAQQKNLQLSQAYALVKNARPTVNEHYEWLNA